MDNLLKTHVNIQNKILSIPATHSLILLNNKTEKIYYIKITTTIITVFFELYISLCVWESEQRTSERKEPRKKCEFKGWKSDGVETWNEDKKYNIEKSINQTKPKPTKKKSFWLEFSISISCFCYFLFLFFVVVVFFFFRFLFLAVQLFFRILLCCWIEMKLKPPPLTKIV